MFFRLRRKPRNGVQAQNKRCENANTAKEWQREMNAFLKALLVKSKQKRIKFPRLIEGLSSFRTARTVPSSSFVDSSLD